MKLINEVGRKGCKREVFGIINYNRYAADYSIVKDMNFIRQMDVTFDKNLY
jgi:hypothetical protein